jgi:hypothetical protein
VCVCVCFVSETCVRHECVAFCVGELCVCECAAV